MKYQVTRPAGLVILGQAFKVGDVIDQDELLTLMQGLVSKGYVKPFQDKAILKATSTKGVKK
jgi:hypothetical protein